MNRSFLLMICLSLPLSTSFAADGDWPMWRNDASRTGASANPLPDRLSLLWHQNMGYPDAAFIHQVRMCADATYAPVAAEGLVFVPSNLRDEVAALDLATGKRVWRYITEGPVRFAPVFHDGKLYFGSDDGMLYCLQAASGKLLWKIRGVPEQSARQQTADQWSPFLALASARWPGPPSRQSLFRCRHLARGRRLCQCPRCPNRRDSSGEPTLFRCRRAA